MQGFWDILVRFKSEFLTDKKKTQRIRANWPHAQDRFRPFFRKQNPDGGRSEKRWFEVVPTGPFIFFLRTDRTWKTFRIRGCPCPRTFFFFFKKKLLEQGITHQNGGVQMGFHVGTCSIFRKCSLAIYLCSLQGVQNPLLFFFNSFSLAQKCVSYKICRKYELYRSNSHVHLILV